MTILQVKNLCKKYQQGAIDYTVIQDANFTINKSDFVALIGPSGCGKTTILQLCGLLDNPTSGSIIINGIDMSKANDGERTKIRKDNIGFIYQFHHLMPEFNALENVALPLLIQGKNPKLSYDLANKALNEVELSDKINFKPSQLSGGQQQRVAIARAIVTKPQLILADEPTGNLDQDLSKKIFNLLKNLCKKHQIACLIVTHNLELGYKTDRIFKIENGQVIPFPIFN